MDPDEDISSLSLRGRDLSFERDRVQLRKLLLRTASGLFWSVFFK